MRRRKFLIGSGAAFAASGLPGSPVIPTPKAKGASDVWTLEVYDPASTWTEPVGIMVSQGVGKVYARFPIAGTLDAAKQTAAEYFMSVIDKGQPGEFVHLLDQNGEVRFDWIRVNAAAELQRRKLGESPSQRRGATGCQPLFV
jgi:hypothetical protein